MNQKISRQLSYWFGVTAVGLLVGLSLQFAKAWTEPSAAPPGGNVGGPITTGVSGQTKSGGLNVLGNVGIGTSSPENKLHVVNPNGAYSIFETTGSGSYGGVNLRNDGVNSYLGSTASRMFIYVGDGTTEDMTISNNGNVGIDRVSPDAKLDVNGNVKIVNHYFDANDDIWLRIRNDDGGSYKDLAVGNFRTAGINYAAGCNLSWGSWCESIRLDNGTHSAMTNHTGNNLFGLHSNGTFYWANTQGDWDWNDGTTNGFYTMWLDTEGNLVTRGQIGVFQGGSGYYGIGSVAPGAGDADANRPSIAGFTVQRFNYHTGLSFSAHSAYGGIRFYNQGYDASVSNPYLISGAPVMSITDGAVGIGTTNPGSYKLYVAGKINGDELCMLGVCRSTWPSAGGNVSTSGGTANYVPAWTNASTLVNSMIYYNPSTTRVGIGNANPQVTLDVTGNIRSTGYIQLNPGQNLYLGSDGKTDWSHSYFSKNGNTGGVVGGVNGWQTVAGSSYTFSNPRTQRYHISGSLSFGTVEDGTTAVRLLIDGAQCGNIVMFRPMADSGETTTLNPECITGDLSVANHTAEIELYNFGSVTYAPEYGSTFGINGVQYSIIGEGLD